MDDLVQQGINAFKSGNQEGARKLLLSAIKQNPDNERAWGWMYNVSLTNQERIYCLNQVLRINPQNQNANQLLQKLIAYTPQKNVQSTPEKRGKPEKPNRTTTMYILVGLVAFFLFITAGFVGYYYNGPCGVTKVKQAYVPINEFFDKWVDAENIASSTPRISLASPISNLQSLQNDFSKVEVPACMQDQKNEMLSAMDDTIQAYISFMGFQPDYIVGSYLDQSSMHLKNFIELGKKVQACAPFCP